MIFPSCKAISTGNVACTVCAAICVLSGAQYSADGRKIASSLVGQQPTQKSVGFVRDADSKKVEENNFPTAINEAYADEIEQWAGLNGDGLGYKTANLKYLQEVLKLEDTQKVEDAESPECGDLEKGELESSNLEEIGNIKQTEKMESESPQRQTVTAVRNPQQIENLKEEIQNPKEDRIPVQVPTFHGISDKDVRRYLDEVSKTNFFGSGMGSRWSKFQWEFRRGGKRCNRSRNSCSKYV
jgi:hypothetical protein